MWRGSESDTPPVSGKFSHPEGICSGDLRLSPGVFAALYFFVLSFICVFNLLRMVLRVLVVALRWEISKSRGKGGNSKHSRLMQIPVSPLNRGCKQLPGVDAGIHFDPPWTTGSFHILWESWFLGKHSILPIHGTLRYPSVCLDRSHTGIFVVGFASRKVMQINPVAYMVFSDRENHWPITEM